MARLNFDVSPELNKTIEKLDRFQVIVATK